MGDIMALITRNICMENKYGRPIQSNSYQLISSQTPKLISFYLFSLRFFFKTQKIKLNTVIQQKHTPPSTRDRIVIFHFVELICARAAL